MTKEEIIDFCEMKSQLEPENEDVFNYIIKAIEQEPFINKPCVSSGVCEHDKQKVLDNIRAKIEAKIVKRPWLNFEDRERDRNDAFLEVLEIIDKYKAEGSGEE